MQAGEAPRQIGQEVMRVPVNESVPLAPHRPRAELGRGERGHHLRNGLAEQFGQLESKLRFGLAQSFPRSSSDSSRLTSDACLNNALMSPPGALDTALSESKAWLPSWLTVQK